MSVTVGMVAALAVISAYIVAWGRTGRRWSVLAYFFGSSIGLAFAVALAYTSSANPTAMAAAIGGAIPFVLLVPLAGVWTAKRSFQRANALAASPSQQAVPVGAQVTAIASVAVSAAIILGAFLVGGVYTAVAGKTGELQGGTTYVVNRFTGSVTVCNVATCKIPREELPADFFDDLKPKN